MSAARLVLVLAACSAAALVAALRPAAAPPAAAPSQATTLPDGARAAASTPREPAKVRAEVAPLGTAQAIKASDPTATLRVFDDTARPGPERARALATLVGSHPLLAGRAAQEALARESDPALRVAALRALGSPDVAAHVTGAARLLLEALTAARDAETALAAGDALEALGAPAGELDLAVYRAALPEARVALARALARAEGDGAGASLRALARHDPSPLVRAEALAALASTAAPDFALARELLGDPAVAPAAARALVRDPSPASELAVLGAFARGDESCAAFARALAARPGSVRARAALVEASLGAAPASACASVEALATCGATAPLRDVLARGLSPSARARALHLLCGRGLLARPELEALVGDPTPEVRDAARAALAGEGRGS